MRKAICAPEGYSIVVVDSSQIECRVLNVFAGQDDVVEKFRRNEDIYIGIASQAYGREITKEDKAERGTGKQLELSCGYGAGGPTIQKTARLGIYGPPVEIDLAEAERWKHLYRDSHQRVVALWKEADRVLNAMDHFTSMQWGPLEVVCDVEKGTRRIRVPGCAELVYDSLSWSAEDNGWQVKTRRGTPTRMYGAKLVENVVQYMARIIISQAMNRITAYGIKIATTTHDELVAVVPKALGQKAYEIMVTEMCREPSWLPGIPLAAEGGVSDRYEK